MGHLPVECVIFYRRPAINNAFGLNAILWPSNNKAGTSSPWPSVFNTLSGTGI